MLKNIGIAVVLLVFGLSYSAFAQDDKAKKAEIKLKACGTKVVKYKADTDKKQHPTPEAPADKALIYVLRTTILGNKVQSKIAVDGDWKGVNRGRNYFFFTVDAGEHYFCSESENQDVLVLKVEAGKTYYLLQEVEPGFLKARTNLIQFTEEKGKEKLKDVHLSVFELKQ
jgi:Protein of unknown function (DUF2846)